MRMSDLESGTSIQSLLGSNAPFPLMSKDTRAGSRRTEPQIVAVRRVFRHKRGAQLLHKDRANSGILSDAPALEFLPAEHVTWNKDLHYGT